MKIYKKGFTLLEMLLVIAIIAILAGIVIVAINPTKQIADANNAQRNSDVLAILNALHQYRIDNGGKLVGLSIGTTSDSTKCPTSGTKFNESNFAPKLVPDYLPAIPFDPSIDDPNPTNHNDQYRVFIDINGRIMVCAPASQDNNGEKFSDESTEHIKVKR